MLKEEVQPHAIPYVQKHLAEWLHFIGFVIEEVQPDCIILSLKNSHTSCIQ